MEKVSTAAAGSSVEGSPPRPRLRFSVDVELGVEGPQPRRAASNVTSVARRVVDIMEADRRCKKLCDDRSVFITGLCVAIAGGGELWIKEGCQIVMVPTLDRPYRSSSEVNP